MFSFIAMFKKLIFAFLIPLISAAPVQCQQLAKSDLLADLHFLNEAVTHGHPVNYDRKETAKVDFEKLIAEVQQKDKDSLSWREYESAIRQAVWEIGCVHTTITKSPIRTKEKNKSGFFPLKIFTDGKALYASQKPEADAKLTKGDEIVSINGIPAAKIIQEMLQYKAPDGRSIDFGKEIMNRNFTALFFFCFGTFDSYEVIFLHGTDLLTENFKGKDQSVLKSEEVKLSPAKETKILFTAKNASFGIIGDSIAYLRLESFDRKCKSFYKEVFAYLKAHPTKSLILDLRNNLGGSRTNVEILLSYLIQEPASYDIIRPKENLGKYLKGSNKMKFMASFMAFDLKRIFHTKRVADGMAFTYNIKPKKHIYQQPIYVLVNGFSASSSSLTTAYLRHHRKAIVIGEQTGGGEFMNNGGSFPNLVLPKSGIEIKTSVYRFQYDFPGQGRSGVIPDYPVKYDVQSYMQTDLEMKCVLELIAK